MSSDRSQPTAASVPAQPIIIREASPMFGRYGRWLLVALFIMGALLVSGYSKYHSYFNPSDGPQEKYHSLSKSATQKIAVISVDGAILQRRG